MSRAPFFENETVSSFEIMYCIARGSIQYRSK